VEDPATLGVDRHLACGEALGGRRPTETVVKRGHLGGRRPTETVVKRVDKAVDGHTRDTLRAKRD